jgi:DNA-binding NtrC family response regulator
MSTKKAIIIIDDEFIILESLRIQLSRIIDENIILEAAFSGEESQALIDEFYNDGIDIILIISDYNLDDTKGTAILSYAHQKFPNSKKVILSGQSDIDEIADFNNSIGLHASFSKPWIFEELKESILKAINA